ncbi:hypothetical protein IKZ77_01770 [Candidatus Saccharibacteria bacterium]|nr:hypothetical protein [Candidatus Saccharibacteria bacterium]
MKFCFDYDSEDEEYCRIADSFIRWCYDHGKMDPCYHGYVIEEGNGVKFMRAGDA